MKRFKTLIGVLMIAIAPFVSYALLIATMGGMTPPVGSSSGGGGSSAMSPRVFTLTIAASDTVSKTGADYVCTGTNDQTTINAALTAAPSNAKIFLRNGSYYCQGSINAFKAGQTLCGESRPTFASWGGGYGNFDPLGSGAKLIFDTSGVTGIAWSGLRNVTIEKLYIVQTNATHDNFRYDGNAIVVSGDMGQILDCQISGWFVPLDFSCDTGRIIDCRFDTNGYAAQTAYNGTVVERCRFYGVNGPALWIKQGTGGSTIAINNQIAMFRQAGIVCNTARAQIIDNQIFAPTDATASAIAITSRSGSNPHGCIIKGNSIQMSNFQDGSAGTNNTSGNGIQIGGKSFTDDDNTAVNYCSLTNNFVQNAGGANSTGFALAFLTSSTKNVATTNVFPLGKFQSGVGTVTSPGTGNVIANDIDGT